MKPNRNSSPQRLALQWLTGALSLAIIAARRGDVLAVLWLASALPNALELRGRGGARMFLGLQATSAALVVGSLALAPAGHRGPEWSEILLLLAVMIRGGMFPFHAWVPRLFDAAPIGSALVFVQSQMGSYLLARDTVAAPTDSVLAVFDVLAVVTLLYGAALALVQRSARRGLGYLAVSQTALVLVGFADGGQLGATGALLVILAAGLAQTGFGLALVATEARRGTIQLDQDGGGHAATPALAGSLLVLGLSAIGLPGTLAFVAEDLVFNTTLTARPLVGIAMIAATAMNGATVLRYAFRIFGGKKRTSGEGDLTVRERVVLASLGATLFGLGIFPQPLLASARTAVEHLRPHHVDSADRRPALPEPKRHNAP